MQKLSDQEILDLLEISQSSLGYIFIDLNDTLIDDKTARINVKKEILIDAIKKIKKLGWIPCLCSDSPHEPLTKWGLSYGIDGPAIAENGMLLNNKIIFQDNIDFKKLRLDIEEWLRENNIAILPEVEAVEFGGRFFYASGVAFGKGRVSSLSIFCFQDGRINRTIPYKIKNYASYIFPDNLSIDFAPQYGNITFHEGNYCNKKARLLNIIGKILAKQNKSCWMIGNSISDITYSDDCKVGMVANASWEVRKFCDIDASKIFTKGVIELLEMITTK